MPKPRSATRSPCADPTGATVRLLLTPEGPEHHKLYGPDGRDRVAAYAADLGRELSVPVTDARGWLDETDFVDSHHALRRGCGEVHDPSGPGSDRTDAP